MSIPRCDAASVLLPTGKLLVVGGYDSIRAAPLNGAELYDPVARSWSPAAPMSTARYDHTATLLGSGQVLVTGGYTANGPTPTAELYDPIANVWQAVASLTVTRYGHTATLLSDGDVAVVGGTSTSQFATSSVEVFSPVSGQWSSLAIPPLVNPRSFHTAARLANGDLLIAGGANLGSLLGTAELYHSDESGWAIEPMGIARSDHTATRLENGRVLIAGGFAATGVTSSTELY